MSEERDADEPHGSHRHRDSTSQRSQRHGTRRRFFLAATLGGFLVGWMSVAVGVVLEGYAPRLIGWPVAAISIVLLPLAYGLAVVINNAYSEHRRRQE